MNNNTTREPLTCRRCGCAAVQWRQTKTGKWYLAVRTFESDNPRYAAAMSSRPHSCAAHEFHGSNEMHQAQFYATGPVRMDDSANADADAQYDDWTDAQYVAHMGHDGNPNAGDFDR